ncbi:hypothetical protein BDY24DRAFT_417008 [Mrakia frigida]|uniref:uncharacterized protein n=1 Tax=Mrakia frigida TaxID=29902 RepID=UPI003FCBF1C1
MPPRARSSSPPNDDQPPANFPRQHLFHVDSQDEDSDIVVRASDGWSFALKRLHLQANSEVFADMLEVANEAPRGVGLEHLPVVDITEEAQETALFLRHLVSSKYLVDSKPPSFLLPNGYVHGYLLDSVLVMCQKYQTPLVRSVLIQIHCTKLMETQPRFAFGLAVAHGELEWARSSLRLFSERYIEAVGCTEWSSKLWEIRPDQRDLCLSDINHNLLARFPLSAIISFTEVHAKVVGTKGPSSPHPILNPHATLDLSSMQSQRHSLPTIVTNSSTLPQTSNPVHPSLPPTRRVEPLFALLFFLFGPLYPSNLVRFSDHLLFIPITSTLRLHSSSTGSPLS